MSFAKKTGRVHINPANDLYPPRDTGIRAQTRPLTFADVNPSLHRVKLNLLCKARILNTMLNFATTRRFCCTSHAR